MPPRKKSTRRKTGKRPVKRKTSTSKLPSLKTKQGTIIGFIQVTKTDAKNRKIKPGLAFVIRTKAKRQIIGKERFKNKTTLKNKVVSLARK